MRENFNVHCYTKSDLFIYLFIFPFPMVIESIELDIILSLVKAIETAVTMTPFFIYLFIIIFFKIGIL